MVTHSGLTAGYQIAQISHAVADFARFQPEHFSSWHSRSQYIVALQTPCSESLRKLMARALHNGLQVVAFREPDLGGELTSLAFVPAERNRKFLRLLPLAGKPAEGAKAKPKAPAEVSS